MKTTTVYLVGERNGIRTYTLKDGDWRAIIDVPVEAFHYEVKDVQKKVRGKPKGFLR